MNASKRLYTNPDQTPTTDTVCSDAITYSAVRTCRSCPAARGLGPFPILHWGLAEVHSWHPFPT